MREESRAILKEATGKHKTVAQKIRQFQSAH